MDSAEGWETISACRQPQGRGVLMNSSSLCRDLLVRIVRLLPENDAHKIIGRIR